jgi:glycine cleavage system aminomethyltransferase T
MRLDPEIYAIRHAVALSDAHHVTPFRMSGPDAFQALEVLCPLELHMIDGQMRQMLLLRDDGTPLADLTLCRDDEDFLLLAEGPGSSALMDHLRAHIPAELEVEIEDLTGSHRILSLNGPYAWELLGEIVGPEVAGVPYLTFFRADDWLCFRGGKTGEFGFDLLVPARQADDVRTRLLEAGAAFDLCEAGLEALDQCALENWFFNIRREGQAGLTPLELQLQWRVSYRKQYVGAEALRRRRQSGLEARTTCVIANGPMRQGDQVMRGDRCIGRLLNAGYSPLRGDHVGMALIELPFAHPGIDRYTLETDAGRLPLRTVSPPVIHNRSLVVDPRRHSYRTRAADAFPPLF